MFNFLKRLLLCPINIHSHAIIVKNKHELIVVRIRCSRCKEVLDEVYINARDYKEKT